MLKRLYSAPREEALSPKSGQIFSRTYSLKYIEKVADNIGSLTHDTNHGAETTNDVSSTKYSIADLYEFVNQFDKEFSPAPEVNNPSPHIGKIGQ